MRMYIILVVSIYPGVNIKPSLYTHIIGFPYHINSKSSNNDDNGNQEIETALDTSIYKPLYEIANKYLQNGYSVLYTAEPLPHETDKSKIIENIQNVHTDNIDEVQNNISKGLLTVIDSDTIYKENTSGTYIVDFLLSNVSRMKQKAQHMTKGAMILNAPDPFFSHGNYDVFLDFEEIIDKALLNDIGLLCWYRTKWLNKLSLAYTISLLTNHKCTIDKQWKYKEWDPHRIIDVVSKGIDNNLGEGSSVLLFQTMRAAYKLNQDDIIYRPIIFEETLKKLLGKDDVNSLINSIFEEIKKEAGFTLIGSTSNER
jgi:hypothetical protein